MPLNEWEVLLLREIAELALSDPIGALEITAPPARYLDTAYLRVACDLLEMAARRLREGAFDLEVFALVVDDAARHVRLSRRTVEAMRDGAAIPPSRTPRRASPQPSLARFRPYLAEVAGRYTTLRKAGARLVGRCPLHEDAHPSFVCYPDGRFFCFGCLQWGDAVDLVSRMEGVSIPQAAARRARWHISWEVMPMVQRGRPLVLGWYAFLAWNVVLFHGLAALASPVPAKVLAVVASVALAASCLVQLALLARAQVLDVRSRGFRAAVNRRSGEVLSRNGEAARARRPGPAAPSTR